MNNLSWKKEALVIFEEILKECVSIEDYENAARLRDNITFLKSNIVSNLDAQTQMPHPYETIEDDESIFIRFIPKENIDSKINDFMEDDLGVRKSKRKKKK